MSALDYIFSKIRPFFFPYRPVDGATEQVTGFYGFTSRLAFKPSRTSQLVPTARGSAAIKLKNKNFVEARQQCYTCAFGFVLASVVVAADDEGGFYASRGRFRLTFKSIKCTLDDTFRHKMSDKENSVSDEANLGQVTAKQVHSVEELTAKAGKRLHCYYWEPVSCSPR